MGLGIDIDGSRERRPEARKVCAAVTIEDRVGKGEDVFIVAVVPLESDLDLLTLLVLVNEINRVVVKVGLGPVEISCKLFQAPFEQELFFAVATLVQKLDFGAGVHEGEFSEVANEKVGVKLEDGKDLGIRFEVDDGAGSTSGSYSLEGLFGYPSIKRLFPHLAVPVDLDSQPLGQEVDHADAYSVKPPGYLVRVAVEFPSCVELGHDDLGGRFPGLAVGVNRDPAAIIGHCDCLVSVNDNGNM